MLKNKKKFCVLKFFFKLSLLNLLETQEREFQRCTRISKKSRSRSRFWDQWQSQSQSRSRDLKKKSQSQSRSWDYKKQVSVSVSKLRLNKRKSRSRSRYCKPSLADLWDTPFFSNHVMYLFHSPSITLKHLYAYPMSIIDMKLTSLCYYWWTVSNNFTG